MPGYVTGYDVTGYVTGYGCDVQAPAPSAQACSARHNTRDILYYSIKAYQAYGRIVGFARYNIIIVIYLLSAFLIATAGRHRHAFVNVLPES